MDLVGKEHPTAIQNKALRGPSWNDHSVVLQPMIDPEEMTICVLVWPIEERFI